ncbi:hypothetical protein O181_058979 [Austropuccinia psidii MF-1]|uniref:Uncharacterized protein n=1 Tax=Austropuccinia psidii MF-1 TaxID=1389203 RepID=A0A9Q3HY67_9BASI|nr:hypothetical protein [Austropuccinia psidii MF-1]
MSPVHLRNLGFQRNQPEDRGGLSRTRRPGGGHLGDSGGWKEIDRNNTHSATPISIQKRHLKPEDWKDMDQCLQLHQLLKDLFQWSIDNKRFNLASHWSELGASCQKIFPKETVQTPGGEGKQGKGESSHFPSYSRTTDPDRAYSDSFRIASSRPKQISSGFTPFRNQKASGQESPFFTIPGSFQEETRTQGQKQDLFQLKAERLRPNDPGAVGIGEKSTQEQEIAVHTSRISIPINRNITPTWIENNVDTSESNLKSVAMWLQISQFAEKTQKQFAEVKASHERMKTLTASIDKIDKTVQEEHSQLRKSSEETM